MDLDGNPSDPSIIESICTTQELDTWFQNRHAQDEEYWNDLGVGPRSMYFGSTTGAFRIYPARQSSTCGVYDPRVRPWYVAGSSGPKNIVLIIDVSGSMSNYGRLDNAKEAAARIVNTLTVSDRVAIVPFSDDASRPIAKGDVVNDVVGLINGVFYRATKENKAVLVDAINALKAGGGTNIYAGFDTAFDIFDQSIRDEIHINCNSALIFLTDGEITMGPDEAAVVDLVARRTQDISEIMQKPIILFSYSVSEQDDVHEFPSQLACSVENGVWTKISTDKDILDALSSYYKLFALGLGEETFDDFAAWVEPYSFATGGLLGTTVSAPVYDRTDPMNPPIFLGVVGVDFSLQAIDYALSDGNEEDAREESIKRIVATSEASCPPPFSLTQCELQSWSHDFTPDEGSQCDVTCSGNETIRVKEEPCVEALPYPAEVFHNYETKDRSFEERVCCKVGETTTSEECKQNKKRRDP